jgi:hypothetical protein
VRYTGPAGCDDPEPFWRALVERTARVSPSELPSAEILLDVQLQPSRRGVLGMLQIVRAGFATEPRYVEAARCDEVVQALALTAALGIDPEALTHVPQNANPPEPEGDEVPSLPFNWHGALEAEVIGAGAVDAGVNLGGFAAIAIVAERPSTFAPKLRFGGAATRSALFDPTATSRYTLSVVAIDACPFRFGDNSLAVRTCGAFLWGALVGEGRNVSDPESTRRAWLSLGPSLQLEFGITRALHWQLDVAAHVPLFHQRYYQGLGSDRVASTLAISPWLGAGMSFSP